MNLPGKFVQHVALMLPSVLVIPLLWHLAHTGQPVSVEAAFVGTVLLSANLLYFTAYALSYLQRLYLYHQCSGDSDQLHAYRNELLSEDRNRVRLALQVMADVWEHPFGLVECWPLDRMGYGRVQSIAALYSLAAETGRGTGSKTVREELAEQWRSSPAGQRMVEKLRNSVNLAHREPAPLPEDIDAAMLALELPPLAAPAFLRAMRSRVGGMLYA